MILAAISYILLHVFLLVAKAQSDAGVDENKKAEIVAKVQRIIDVIDYILVIWFKVLIGLAGVATILLCVTILGIVFDATTITSIKLFEFGSIAQIVKQFGTPTVISTIALSIIPLLGIPYLLMKIFSKKK